MNESTNQNQTKFCKGKCFHISAPVSAAQRSLDAADQQVQELCLVGAP